MLARAAAAARRRGVALARLRTRPLNGAGQALSRGSPPCRPLLPASSAEGRPPTILFARRRAAEINSFCDQLIRLAAHQPAKRVMSARREFNHLIRSMPLRWGVRAR